MVVPGSFSRRSSCTSDDDNTTDNTNNPDRQHDWEHSKENAAPLECGRSIKSLSKRAFGTSVEEQIMIEQKTKKYERLVRRSERAVEWLQEKSKKLIQRSAVGGAADGAAGSAEGADGAQQRDLTEKEAQFLRDRLRTELGFDPSTSDRDNIDFDPLRYWVLYIKHIRESYASDSQKQFLLMERCSRTFMNRPFLVPAYQNDVRFIRICILYADKTSNPSEVFKLMSKIKVGTKVALFWVAWAWVAEKASNFQFTEKIFLKALSVGAEPRKYLEERRKQFLRRMSRHWLNANKTENEEEDLGDEEHGGRGALNSLSSAGVDSNNRSSGFNGQGQGGNAMQGNVSRRLPPQPPQQERSRNTSQSHHNRVDSKSLAGFAIFQDNDENNRSDVLNDEHDAPGHAHLTRESERTKENKMRPEQWNERGYGLVDPSSSSTHTTVADSIVGTVRSSSPRGMSGQHNVRGPSVPVAFDVFVDEDCNPDENESNEKLKRGSKTAVEDRSLRQRIDGGAADRIRRDPLRYMKNPSKVVSDQVKYDGVSSINATSETKEPAKRHEKPPTKKEYLESTHPARKGNVTITDMKDGKATDPILIAQIGENDELGQECCFEELRARRRCFKLISSDENFNLLARAERQDEGNSSHMEVEEESVEEVDMDENEEPVESDRNHKSILKLTSSIRRKRDDQHGNHGEEAAVNPRRVLFAANTNESLNTSTASSQLNGSFAQVEETINTKVANAEISMMFCSPNKSSTDETPGKLVMASALKPLFSTNRKQNGSNNHRNSKFDDNNVSRLADKVASSPLIADDKEENDCAAAIKENIPAPKFTIFSDECDDAHDGTEKENIGSTRPNFSGGTGFRIFQEDVTCEANRPKIESKEPKPTFTKQPRDSGGDTASFSMIGDIITSQKNDSLKNEPNEVQGFTIFSDHDERPKRPPSEGLTSCHKFSQKQTHPKSEMNSDGDTASLSVIGEIMGSLKSCAVEETGLENSRNGFTISLDSGSSVKNHGSNERTQNNPAAHEIFYDSTKEQGQINASSSNVKTTNSKNSSSNMRIGIYEDPSSTSTVHKSTTVNIQVFDENNTESGSEKGSKERTHNNPAAFKIFDDSTKEQGQMNASSSKVKVTNAPNSSSNMRIGIYEDPSSTSTVHKSTTLNIQVFDETNTESGRSHKSSGSGFKIFSDEGTSSVQKKRRVTNKENQSQSLVNNENRVEDEPCFGDISRIETLDGEKTSSNFPILDESNAADASSKLSSAEDTDISAIDYTSCHRDCMKNAMSSCMRAASKRHGDLQIFNYSRIPLSKEFLRKSFSKGMSIDLSSEENVTIINELGRGVHGVVLLCNVSHSKSEEEKHSVAVKIQAPIGSLAHEFSLLLKVEKRINPEKSCFYPFPRSKALYSFSNGGLFLMTAGSNSGMTLVDVANTFKQITNNVPELIALYYTSRMLRHLESLHQKCHILHCDVKPDNWVVTSTSNKDERCAGTDAVDGADVMLVDFGRAVDLSKMAGEGANPLAFLFKGSAAAEDMECGTMRQGLPWGVDLDFFGLCASSFILLFGLHMEVIQDKKTKRWRLQKPFRRYWQKDLWQNFFDSLLNYDVKSDGNVLYEVRCAFDDFINGKDRKREIASHLEMLYNHLPKKR